jgi:tetratricopeptide (TPR) repeat protein
LLEGKPVDERFGMTGIASVVTRLPRAMCLAELGELAEGIVWAEEAVRIAETVGDPFSLVAAYLHLSYPYLVKGDLDKALPILERGLHICRNAHVAVWLSWASAELGYTYLHLGRNAEALPLLEQAVKGRGAGITFGFHFCWLSEAYLQAGRWYDANEVGRRGLNRARKFKERGHEAWALHLLGEIAALHRDPPDVGESEDHYRQALALARELGMRPLIAHCHVGLGKLYRRIGNPQRAKEHLTTATKMMREMEMGLWLENAEAELKELG